jgi:uncharacterized protein YecE (DUF72 family)
MNLWVGTSGYSYAEWKGPFYPEDLPASKMLHYYSRRLNSVEINNTFYRMPTPKLIEGWVEQVPEGFSFVLKAPQRITHRKKLKDTQDDIEYFASTAAGLGTRRGPVLVQLPPWLKKDIGLLREFLATLPDGFRAAFEFRSSTWFDDETYGALADHRAALVAADTGDEKLPAVIERTAPFAYARLRREEYAAEELREWVKRLVTPDWEDLYVFFKHEDAGTGPRLAEAFRAAASPA